MRVFSICYNCAPNVRGGYTDHVSLKLKESFHVLSSSSSFGAFCMVATTSQIDVFTDTAAILILPPWHPMVLIEIYLLSSKDNAILAK